MSSKRYLLIFSYSNYVTSIKRKNSEGGNEYETNNYIGSYEKDVCCEPKDVVSGIAESKEYLLNWFKKQYEGYGKSSVCTVCLTQVVCLE
jgi:hypothetical protein